MSKLSRSVSVSLLFLGFALFFAACSDDPPASGCVQDKDCERGSICGVDGACLQQQCTVTGDCGPNRSCYNNVCYRAECVSNEECASFGADYVCLATVCQPPQACTTRQDCQALGKICNAFTGQCVDPPLTCTSDVECVYPEVCDTSDGSCKTETACTADTECEAGKYCDVTSGGSP